jgi:hypothetical protein
MPMGVEVRSEIDTSDGEPLGKLLGASLAMAVVSDVELTIGMIDGFLVIWSLGELLRSGMLTGAPEAISLPVAVGALLSMLLGFSLKIAVATMLGPAEGSVTGKSDGLSVAARSVGIKVFPCTGLLVGITISRSVVGFTVTTSLVMRLGMLDAIDVGKPVGFCEAVSLEPSLGIVLGTVEGRKIGADVGLLTGFIDGLVVATSVGGSVKRKGALVGIWTSLLLLGLVVNSAGKLDWVGILLGRNEGAIVWVPMLLSDDGAVVRNSGGSSPQ